MAMSRKQMYLIKRIPGYAVILLEETLDNNPRIRVAGLKEPIATILELTPCKLWMNILVIDQNQKTTEKWFVLKKDNAGPGLICKAESPPDMPITEDRILG